MPKKIVHGRIYLIANTVNKKVYIGKTVKKLNKRWGGHRFYAKEGGRDLPIYNAMRKHGIDNFSIREIDHAYSHRELIRKEKKWIAYYNSIRPGGYNITHGGEGCLGYKHTPERVIKMSKAAKKRWKDPKERAKQSERTRSYFEDPKARIRSSVVHKRPDLVAISISALQSPTARRKRKTFMRTKKYREQKRRLFKRLWRDPTYRSKLCKTLSIARRKWAAEKKKSRPTLH